MITEHDVKELLSKILISKIEKIEKHENADRLQIISISVGNALNSLPQDIINEDKTVQVVTAANNFKEGDLVPYLSSGNLVPAPFFEDGTEFRLESRPMRGEISHGMLLAVDEIGIGEDHSGILVLNDNPDYSITDSNIGESFDAHISESSLKNLYKKYDIAIITDEIQTKIDLIMSIGNPENGGEVVGEKELLGILTSGEDLYTYDGFEPSGQMHIAQGIIRAINTNKMIKAGFTFRMWVADWFGYLNNKMGGDIENIQTVGKYFIEIWRAAGMNLENTEFLWTSEAIKDPKYWELVMKVSKNTTLKRMLKTTEIMGRSESDDLSAAQILYPAMQTTDIFHVMKAQVTQLGMDQRKVNMLAREIGEELGFWKPVVVSHGMLQGLGKPVSDDMNATDKAIAQKMSKSKPDTAIFMTDSKKDIERKIRKAYCPEGEIESNPILDYCKQIIFEAHHLERDKELLEDCLFVIERKQEHGGTVSFTSYKELESAYLEKSIYPLDLKNAVVKYIDELVKPVRSHFNDNAEAKKILKKVKSLQVTR